MRQVPCDELLNMAMNIGYQLLINGAEIYRVEESIQRILAAYDMRDCDIFAVPSCIFVTVNTPEGHPFTKLKRVPSQTVNLDRLERINDLCRRICRDKPEVRQADREVRVLARRPSYRFAVQIAAYALISFSFTLFFGGKLADAACAFVCGAVIKLICHGMGRLKGNAFFTDILASAAVVLLAALMARAGLAPNSDKVIIGALMTLVPGIMITTFMRDIMAGDVLAGLIRFVESLLVAASIAIGAGAALVVPRLLFGV